MVFAAEMTTDCREAAVNAPAAAGDDRPLARRCRAGEAAAFDELVALHQTRLAGLAHRLLAWPQDVDDVVQEVFLAALRKLPQFRGESSLATWLTRVTVNVCRSRRRRQRLHWRWWRRQTAGAPTPVAAPAAEDVVGRNERRAAVHAALRRLAQADREVLVLHYLQEMPAQELAAVLGLKRNAVEARLHRARKRLRAMLPEEFRP